MCLWSERVAYTPECVNLLARIHVFLAFFYVPLWLKSSNGSEGAIDDISFIHSMLNVVSIDAVIATAALEKILKHSWYLIKEIVVYALFPDNLHEQHKKAFAQKLPSVPRPDSFRRGPTHLTQIIDRNTTLANLIGLKSWCLLQVFGINNDWLQWPEYQRFNDIHCFVHTVKVVIDAAERGIKLNTNYATIPNEDKRHKSSLIQAVEKHRQDYPDFRKSTLTQFKPKTFDLDN